ncbi:MAG: energy transducer TonB [Nitrospirae bacterium]|nr:MAG: energy transducer TonB [Nitrospirota bacterium]
MTGLRQTVFFSVMLHTSLIAAALILGGSSAIKDRGLFTVSLLDDWARDRGTDMVRHTPAAPAASTTSKEKPAAGGAPLVQRRSPAAGSSVAQPSVPLISAAEKPIAEQAAQGPPLAVDPRGKTAGTALQTRPEGFGQGLTSGISGKSGERKGTGTTAGAGRPEAGEGQNRGLLIRSLLQKNLVYPFLARKKGLEGTVLMEFHISEGGIPGGIRIAAGSGHSILDAAAKETVQRASPLPVVSGTVEVPITFRLKDQRIKQD